MVLRTRFLAAGLIGAAFVFGCRTNSSFTTVQVISKVLGDSQTGTVGSVLPVHPAVRVTDSDSLPVPSVNVLFAVSGGGGTIAGANAMTGADGIATAGDWRLGPTPGANSVTANVSNAVVHFVATAVAALPGMAGP